ncbi:MAG TPA: YihY/virulence factor BrkB family protein [Chloroflexota bacterium]|jgi:membrane protein|nr:YihY/virulence factor BrkB family protein [Chloroflexota bacterium]
MTETPPTVVTPAQPDRKDHRIAARDPWAQRVWDHVSRSPLQCLWSFEGTAPSIILKRTAKSFIDDDLLSRAAELGFYFLFALFPMLICASAILGIAARGASGIYIKLLNYLAMVVPPSAYDLVIQTFNQTTQAASSGKITLGLIAALWSASVGFAAIQDTMNLVYKVKETRPYWKARGSAILVTILLVALITLNLSDLLIGDMLAKYAGAHIWHNSLRLAAVIGIHIITWTVACALLMLVFSTIYYYAPALKTKCWHWLTPGAAIGIATWVLASIGFRVYLHFFNSYSVTYGSLGAVVILLMWFYITGLTLLAGAEINSEIQAAVMEKRLKEQGALPAHATTDPEHPVPVAAVPSAQP